MLWQTLHQLKSKDPAVRRKAVASLHQSPNERAARVLAAVLDDPDVEVRRLAALALGKLEDDRRFESLVKALRDREPVVVQAAAAGLKKAPAEQVIHLLERLLSHADAAVRGQAAQTLDTHGWRPADREQEIWYRVAKAQLFQAAGFGAAAVPALELALALAQLYAAGLTPDFAGWDGPWPRRKLAMPSYPFQRQSFWVQPSPGRLAAAVRP